MTENINNQSFNNQEEESAISLADIWHMIWDYKWWYVACTFFCICAIFFYIYRTPDTYVRTAKVIIDESEQSSTMRNLTQMTGAMTGLRANAQVANEMEAFSSPDLMQKVVEKLRLETRYYEQQFMRSVEYYQNNPVELRLVEGNPQTGFSFTVANKGDNNIVLSQFVIGPGEVDGKVEGKIGENLQTPAGTIAILPTSEFENFANDIRINWSNSMSRAKAFCGNLSVSLSGKESTVVVISLEDTYPARSSSVISSLIDTYNEDWIRNKKRSARNTSDFINERLLLI